MAFSEGQITRLRTRLLYYQQHQGRKELGRDMPWKTVSGRIVLKTGVDVPEERLRQFVEGVPVEKGSKDKHYPVLQEDRLEAVRGFLTHKDVAYLGAHELVEDAPIHHAAYSLSEFINGGDSKTYGGINGEFEQVVHDRGEIKEKRVYFSAAAGSHISTVTEVESCYDHAGSKPFSSWTETDRKRRLRARFRRRGWALGATKNAVIAFLLSADDGKYSHSYFQVSDSSNFSEMALLHFPVPIETQPFDNFMKKDQPDIGNVDPRFSSRIISSVLFFRRDVRKAQVAVKEP